MQFSPNVGERRSKCIFAPKKVAFPLGKWVSEDRGPSFFKEKQKKTKKNKNKKKNSKKAKKRKCQYYVGFIDTF